MRVIDKLRAREADEEANRVPFFSFEYFPPKTEAGVSNLYERLDRMCVLDPAWIDVTWGAGGTTSDLTLELCTNAQNYCGVDVMMHLTCTNMPVENIYSALAKAKEAGIQNILALRGDPPRGESWRPCEGGFHHAADLVRYIRTTYGNYFGIAVAGYPEGHLEAEDKQADLRYLKEKVDAGADFIITQLFYDNQEFLNFVRDCRALGIQCPIIPGIMPIQNYAGFARMTQFCKTKVPQHIYDALEPIKEDDDAVKQYGVRLAVEMCRELVQAGVPGLHFYTLNLEKSAMKILEGLNLLNKETRRALPWRRSARADRQKEDVRPIFWANRPKSYITRTMSWDDFPNGRWGDARSAAFGAIEEYPSMSKDPAGKTADDRRAMWGEPASLQAVRAVFEQYVEGKIARLPWCEGEVHNETVAISEPLLRLNRSGFLTINSQPRVNAAPSTDPVLGWGPRNGYVYQKAYVEFFVSPDQLELLLQAVRRHPRLTYQAVNVRGDMRTNSTEGRVNAVTWGVFPNAEIAQPTVVDPAAFLVWKSEAFALWLHEWAEVYPPESPARAVLQEIHDTWYLCNIVDNDFVAGDLFAVFEPLLQAAPAAAAAAL